jgi:DNA-directed RNA polymerase specialized sigma24 family protein
MVREKLPELIEQYQSYGYSIALQIMRDKHDAEEIVQDVFLKLHNEHLTASKSQMISDHGLQG